MAIVKNKESFNEEKAVKESFGDPHFSAQNINTAVDQAPVRDTPDHGDHQGFLYLRPLLIGIRLSCHKPSPPYINNEIKKQSLFVL